MIGLTHNAIIKAISNFEILAQSEISRLMPLIGKRDLRQAAVMIPMLVHESRWHLLLTCRSKSLVEHSGQVAFPGGAWEQQDPDLKTTALREMHEEIGILPDDVDVFGTLGDISITTGYFVRLFVGAIPWPYILQIDSNEVESAFIVPLNWLANPQHHTVQFRYFDGQKFPVIYFDEYEGHQLWGASAEMTLLLLSVLGLIK